MSTTFGTWVVYRGNSAKYGTIRAYNWTTTSAKADLLRRHLETLCIGNLAEWDVLAFIYKHGNSLASAEQLARFVGYPAAVVNETLDSLASTGLIQRSRNSRGLHLYRFTVDPADPARRLALEEVVGMAEERQGRLLLIECLRPAVAATKLNKRRSGWHLA